MSARANPATDRPRVVLLGTLDTKAEEYRHVRDRIRAQGCQVLLVDAGVLGRPGLRPTVSRQEVARAAGTDLAELVRRADRGEAVAAMAEGSAATLLRLYGRGRLDAVVALGGSGGTSIAARAMRALPIGVPKVLVSTMASGNTRPYVGGSDVTLMYPVVDVAGLNPVSLRVLDNAAAAVAGMARAPRTPVSAGRPLVGASMIGLTMPSVNALRERLVARGYEVLTFHATGAGGASLEALAAEGRLAAVADVTPTELADDLGGGVCSAGPERLTAAGARGLPQVIALGGLDMVNFGPPQTVPPHYRDRPLHAHNPNVTLVRTSPAECAELGRRIAARLNAATGPVALHLTAGGLSLLSAPGAAFHDERADRALTEALLADLAGHVRVRHSAAGVGAADLGTAMADDLDHLYRTHTPAKEHTP